MKTLYLVVIATLTTATLNAQLTLEKQWHEPVAGEQTGVRAYDSTSAIPKHTGPAETWDFSTMVQNSLGATASSFVAPTTVPASSMYPGTTLVEAKNGEYTYFKSGTNPEVFEGLGYQSSLATVNYNIDAMKVFVWPIAYGSNYTDTYSGNITGSFSGNLTGTLQTEATGAGTLILPGSDKYTNVLQLTSMQSATIANNAGVITNISYSYFHTTQKFPLLSVNYFRLTGTAGSIFTYSVLVNKILAVGITDENFESQITLYPNPSHGIFSVKLSNEDMQSCSISIYNSNGQLIRQTSKTNEKTIDENINIKDLPRGMYLVKTQLNSHSYIKKMILQ
jgi:hypothetical protein